MRTVVVAEFEVWRKVYFQTEPRGTQNSKIMEKFSLSCKELFIDFILQLF